MAPALTQDATAWSPELAGGQWGWRLTKYRAYAGAYEIGGRILLLLSTDTNDTDNLLWDPLAGKAAHLDYKDFSRFLAEHVADHRSPYIYSIPLYGGRTFKTEMSPGQSLKCDNYFAYYYDFFDRSHQMIRTFYVFQKIHRLMRTYYTCLETMDRQPVRLTTEYEIAGPDFIDLPDMTLLFIDARKSGTVIVRLDSRLQQHTTMQGQMFVLDAQSVNDSLLSGRGRISDPQYRYDTFLAAIEAVKKSDMR